MKVKKENKADLIKRLALLISVLKKDKPVNSQLRQLEEDVSNWADELTVRWLKDRK